MIAKNKSLTPAPLSLDDREILGQKKILIFGSLRLRCGRENWQTACYQGFFSSLAHCQIRQNDIKVFL